MSRALTGHASLSPIDSDSYRDARDDCRRRSAAKGRNEPRHTRAERSAKQHDCGNTHPEPRETARDRARGSDDAVRSRCAPDRSHRDAGDARAAALLVREAGRHGTRHAEDERAHGHTTCNTAERSRTRTGARESAVQGRSTVEDDDAGRRRFGNSTEHGNQTKTRQHQDDRKLLHQFPSTRAIRFHLSASRPSDPEDRAASLAALFQARPRRARRPTARWDPPHPVGRRRYRFAAPEIRARR